jgi:hypothetical protein
LTSVLSLTQVLHPSIQLTIFAETPASSASLSWDMPRAALLSLIFADRRARN